MVSSASINMKQLLDNMIFYSQCSTCIFKVKKNHSLRNSDNVCCQDYEKLGMELKFFFLFNIDWKKTLTAEDKKF